MNKPQNLPVEGIRVLNTKRNLVGFPLNPIENELPINKLNKMTELQELQKRRFTETMEDVFIEDFNLKTEFDDEGTLVSAKINTHETLDKVQLDMLSFEADSWGLGLQLNRSGAGIKIQFNKIEE